ncbi:MAG: glutamate racemase [Saprospiraceae bacterium]|nr:glutamate racemase [Saprospiraceae bacterium]
MKELSAHQPIGIFDSGIGGLTVANAIVRHLPNEKIIYFGDTAHLPYGDKSLDAIRYFSIRITKFLIDKGCKMIVIACNSASTAANDMLKEFYKNQVHFVNVVDPLVEIAIQKGYKKVGIIATKATVASRVYESKFAEKAPNVNVISLATPLLAPMIEEGFIHNNISQSIINQYLSNPIFEDIDVMLLACTHYPLIKQEIESFFQGKVDVLDSTDIVAEKVKSLLSEYDQVNNEPHPKYQFYVSDFTQSFENTARSFYSHDIHLEHFPLW